MSQFGCSPLSVSTSRGSALAVENPRRLEGGRIGGRPSEGGGLGCLCRASNWRVSYGMAWGCHRAGDDHGETVGGIGGELGAGWLDHRGIVHAGIIGQALRAGDGVNILTRRG